MVSFPKDADSQGLSAMWHAYLNGHWAMVDALLAEGASVDDDLSQGLTPLVHASLFQRGEHLIELIKRGANVETAFISKPANSIFKLHRAGYAAVKNPYHGLRPIDICIVMSAQGQCINESRLSRKRNYLNAVVWQPPRDELFQLTRRRNKTRDVVWRPLGKVAAEGEANYQAAELNRRKMVQALINAGASLEGSPASLSKTPPLVAAAAEHLSEIVGDLLKHGAPVNASDVKGVTAIVAAFGYEHCVCPFHTPSASTADDAQVDPDCRELKPCVELLLEHGAMLGLRQGDSALLRLTLQSRYRKQYLKTSREWTVAPNDKKTLARLLLEKGADPNRLANTESPPPFELVDIDPRGTWLVQDGSKASSPTVLNWPWSPVQHAFLQRDQELCQAFMAEKCPSAEIAKWIFQVSFMPLHYQYSLKLLSPAFDVFAIMPAHMVTGVLQDPACLAWMLANARGLLYDACLRVPPNIQNILATRNHAIAKTLQLKASLFKAKIDAQRWHTRYGNKSLMIGVVCLEEAILIGVPDIVRKLVRLSRSWIRPEGLRLAIFMADNDSKTSLSILKALLRRYRGSFHLDEVETNQDFASDLGLRRHLRCTHFRHAKSFGFDTIIDMVGAETGLPCRNPLLYAICLGNPRVVDLMMAAYENGGAPRPAFDRFYLREACIRLDHAVLGSLLKCASIRAVCELKTGQSPLMFLITTVETLCHGLFTTEQGVNVARSIGYCVAGTVYDMSSDVGMTDVGMPKRFAQIQLWRACIREFELAGVDFKNVTDQGTGKSAYDYIQEYQNYKGNDRFLSEVANALLHK
ncbi:hypothetical protein QBC40DRAFT_258338 [Triangularia verruculosa]|uniref:Uncharacterized protein n=1 Tax=Triangularia verruculosa TaxID=2587418 RepID=A0AAN6XAP7_9PEZI|nr:hypothetical protein QBC40DRAFT_258338 [Triangularia verruculosa]